MADQSSLARGWSAFQAWRRSRNIRFLLGGAPALLVGVLVLGLAVAASLTSREERDLRYLEQARSAFKSRNYALALTCYDRLAPHGANRPEILFGLSQACFARGQTARALVILNALAPREQQGYGPAHLWTARRLLDGSPSDETLRVARLHLRHALNGELEERDAAVGLLGQVYLAEKDYVQAEMYLAKAVKAYPELRLKRAQMHDRLGNAREAKHEAQLAVEYFQARAKSDLGDVRARLTWADGLTFLTRFPEAAAVLKEGLEAGPEPPARSAYRAALGMVYAAWLRQRDGDARADAAEKFRLLSEGLRYDDSNAALLGRLADLARIQGPEADQARETLQALLAQGDGSPLVHFALGVDAWRRGDAASAEVHLKAAQRLAPNLPVIANNLAWVLAQGKADDLPRALELSNLALQRAPNQPAFHGTRGEILVRLGKWNEALTDLEAALPASPKDPRLHRSLAEVYAQLGDPAMSAKHRRQAREGETAPPGGPPAAPGNKG
jgi:predicted Zn-dependent protease